MTILKNIRLLFKEIESFYRFSYKTEESQRQIVFYAEHGDYYPYFEGLIEELTAKHNQTICYVSSCPRDPVFKNSNPRIKTFYLDKALSFFMQFVNCKAFVLTLTDLNQFHLKRSANVQRYVYVFHSLVSTHMKFRESAYDHYDDILCAGPHHFKEIRKREELKGFTKKNLIEAGYYRLERIYSAYQRYLSENNPACRRKKVLIAPSWGDSNVLESCGQELIKVLLDAGFDVIARPHPETVRRSPDLISLFASKFGNNPNFTLELSVASDNSLLSADVLICDSSGVALEYAFGTERPVLFIDVPIQVNNPKFKELGIEPLELCLRRQIGRVISPESLAQVPDTVSELIEGCQVYKKRLAELREENIYSFGYSSSIGAKRIMDIVSNA